MKALWVAAIVVLSLASPGAAAPNAMLRGYTAIEGARERLIESRFIDIPTAQSALDTATVIGARPHYAGTPADYALAAYMRDRMRAFGISAELEPLTARVDTPRELVLELAIPADAPPPGAGRPKSRGRQPAFPIAIHLAEVAEPSDSATAARNIGLPFNAGSGDGDVSAPLVYADRGLDEDYDTLTRAQVDIHGAVVLVRYGAQFRGLLAERAQDHGAAGVIFYSDPKDDGAARGLVYPDGPWRPLTAIERGWVGPGIRIPTLPISAANAQVLLASLQGAVGPPAWGGALPVAYPLARGPGRVHMIVKLNRTPTTLWNTIGVIPGVHGDQSVVLGAYRDAWVYGVGHTGSGVTTVLEVARGFGLLLQGGWRPQRTIVIAGWDGGEIGSAGSRAYAQAHRVDLARGCFAYLNAGEIVGPAIAADAAAAIAPVLVDAAHAVRDPLIPATTIYDRWVNQMPHDAARVGVPAGTDHEAFPGAAGTPIAAIRFTGPFGVYHSGYDTLRYATRWSDPDFSLHRTAAQLYGVVALRLADAGSVPYTFAGYATLLRDGIAQRTTSATRDGLAFDTAALSRAINRLAFIAISFDRTVGQSDHADALSELRAVRTLDTLLYGASGYAGTTFPDIDAALATRDSARIGGAIGRAVDAVNRATNALTS